MEQYGLDGLAANAEAVLAGLGPLVVQLAGLAVAAGQAGPGAAAWGGPAGPGLAGCGGGAAAAGDRVGRGAADRVPVRDQGRAVAVPA